MSISVLFDMSTRVYSVANRQHLTRTESTMSNAAPLPENQRSSRFDHAMARVEPERGEEVKKWAIVAYTVVGLASLVVLHLNGGRAHFARKHTSFSFEVGRERSSTDGTAKPSLPPAGK